MRCTEATLRTLGITFKRYERSPAIPDRKTPWVVHRVEAFVGGDFAGYLHISYIPRKIFQAWFPTFWDYMGRQAGYFGALNPDGSLKDRDDLWRVFCGRSSFKDPVPEPKQRDRELSLYSRPHMESYRKFKDFHMDRPMVDYIKVEDSFKGQGVGYALYQEGARWMAEKSLALYASGIQSEDAKAAWSRMKDHGVAPLREIGKRVVIDYRPEEVQRKSKVAVRKRTPKMGDCFEAAGKYVMDHSDLMGGSEHGLLLVHGEVIGQGPIEGVHFGHGWVEDGDTVIDTSNGRDVRMPKALYYAIGGIDRVNNVYRYTFKQMQEKILSSKHWGPWELRTSSGL